MVHADSWKKPRVALPMENDHRNAMTTGHQSLTGAWQAYKDSLLRFARSRVGNAAIAEDIVQDVFLKAVARPENLNETTNLRAWLYHITRNQIIDYYRLKKPTEPVPEDIASDALPEHGSRLDCELAACLGQMVVLIPEPYREALTLADFDGLKHKELARRLGISVSGAKSRVQRGRRMLKERLLGCCKVDLDNHGNVIDFESNSHCNGC